MQSRLGKKRRNRTAALFVVTYLAVMIVPLSVSMAFYYPRMRSMLIDKATEQAVSRVTQVKDDMDTQLFSVLSMPKYIFENKRIILQNLLSNPIARLAAKEDLELYLGLRARREPGARDRMFLGALTVVLAIAVLVVPPDFVQPFAFDEVTGQVTASVVIVGLLGAYWAILGIFLVIAAVPVPAPAEPTAVESSAP